MKTFEILVDERQVEVIQKALRHFDSSPECRKLSAEDQEEVNLLADLFNPDSLEAPDSLNSFIH